MITWEDEGIVVSSRSHGERGAVVTLLTRDHGRHGGVLRSASSQQNRILYILEVYIRGYIDSIYRSI